jgi:hypothetical protein
LHVKDDLRLDNLRIVEVKARHFTPAIILHRFGYAYMPSRYLDRWICISYLHSFTFLG